VGLCDLRLFDAPSKLARVFLKQGDPIGLKRARVQRAPPEV